MTILRQSATSAVIINRLVHPICVADIAGLLQKKKRPNMPEPLQHQLGSKVQDG